MRFIRKHIYIIGIILLIVLIIFIVIRKNKLDSNNYIVDSLNENDISNDKNNDESYNENYIYVDIKGEVNNPNVYKVSSNLRVFDVISLAGGLTDNADTSNINLAKIVSDEMVIVIKSKEDTTNNTTFDSDTSFNSNDNLIDINTCSIEELLTLPGIGNARANNIIEYRKKNKFNDISDIMNVSGISENLFNKIKEYIKV